MKLDRRTLLIGGGAGVGLIVAFSVWPRHLSSDLSVRSGEEAFGNYIKIARDGRITVAVPQVETGQGIWTALPQIVADELGAAWETIAVEPAPLANDYANPLASEEGWPEGIRITAEATSVRAFLDGKLARFKIPERIIFSAESLPRLGTGKIDRRALKAQYAH